MSLHHALALAGQAVPVFPCLNKPGNRELDKKPLTKHGFKDASTDSQTIRQWWSRYPDALIGVPTGARFAVLDLDLQHSEAREWFATADLPESRTHFTRSGGRHLLFQPHEKVGCTQGKIWPHIDSRGFGGFIIWWPAEGLQVLHHKVLAPVAERHATLLRNALCAVRCASASGSPVRLAASTIRAMACESGSAPAATISAMRQLPQKVRALRWPSGARAMVRRMPASLPPGFFNGVV
jgi:hypothetical protein